MRKNTVSAETKTVSVPTNDIHESEDFQMSNVTNTEVNTVIPMTSGYAALAQNDALADLTEDMTGLTLRYDRVKIPSAASPVFEVPGDGEEAEMVKELRGVILFQHPMYSYYRDAYTGGSNPPDCGSYDGITGSTGQDCATCPLNQFGSGGGQSKACRNKRMLYILQEGEMFPVMFCLPTGSLKTFTEYLKRNLSKGRRLCQIVTKVTLKKAVNAGGINYSQCCFTFERKLAPEEQEAIAPIIAQAKNYAAGLSVAQMAQMEDAPMVDPETGEIVEALA